MLLRPSLRTGGEILVDALKIHGVDYTFCVPGESFLPALDALHACSDTIRTIICRQEGAAAHMAEAYGKLTGKPGVCLVTRGPGATNASIGVHTASQDSTPMILLVGQVGTSFLDRQAWQEVDLRNMFGTMAKWVTQVDHLQRLPEMINRAFQAAVSGRPGPVVIGLPEDILYEELDLPDTKPFVAVQPQPGTAELARLRELIEQADRPLMILGGGGWNAAACDGIQSFSENFQIPVGTAFRRQDLFDNEHANYAGDIGIGIADSLLERVRRADLILAVGARLGETTTNSYTMLGVPNMHATFVHVHPAIDELGKVYRPDLSINSGVTEFALAVSKLKPTSRRTSSAWVQSSNTEYRKTLVPTHTPGALNLAEVVRHVREQLPSDAIVTNGAGNYTGWVHRFFQYRGFRTQLAPASGVMGYGIPAACAAAAIYPERRVVCFAGDGCFLMNSQELATARQYQLRIVFIIVNNGMYGSIRMHQEIHYPERVFGTMLENPDFSTLAKAYGLEGYTVERTDEFSGIFAQALDAPQGALIELRVDPEAITPRTTLSELRSLSKSRL